MAVQAGHPHRRRTTLVAVLAVAAAVVAVAAGVALTSRGRIVVETRSFTLTPTTTLTFAVSKPRDVTVRCALRARDVNLVDVGRLEGVLVGPAPDATVVVTATVPTSAVPTVVEVESCVRVR